MNAVVTIDQVTQFEKGIAALESERDRILERLDNEERAAAERGNQQLAEDRRSKWLETNKNYKALIERKQGELSTMRAALQADQARRDELNKQAAENAERLAKAQARRAFTGTDTEFNAAWPSIWTEIRNGRAVDSVRKATRPQVHI